jgi:ketosteroid isomerase-like protein
MDSNSIVALEEKLRTAMLNSNVSVLNHLLADDLIFTSHLGQIMSKQDDLEAHKTGYVKINSIEQSEQHIKMKNDLAIVSVLSQIQGEFGGEHSEAALRFTRIWQKSKNDNWQIIAAHSSIVL